MVDFLESRGTTSVGVFGFSLGGAVALLTAAEDPRIRAIVAYAPFADLRVLGQDLYGWMSVGRYPFVEGMLLWSASCSAPTSRDPRPGRGRRQADGAGAAGPQPRGRADLPSATPSGCGRAGDNPGASSFTDRGRHGELGAGSRRAWPASSAGARPPGRRRDHRRPTRDQAGRAAGGADPGRRPCPRRGHGTAWSSSAAPGTGSGIRDEEYTREGATLGVGRGGLGGRPS